MRAQSRIIFFDDNNEKFFGEGPCRLLREVERTGSLNGAAASLGMAYTKAMKLMKNAEKALGFPLTVRQVGGRSGGGSVLTEKGRLFLERYEAYRDACIQENHRLFREFFPEPLFGKTALVIMASGQGKRFGSNKLLCDFDGQPMIRRILDSSEGLFRQRLVVTRHKEVEELCRSMGVAVIVHQLPGRNDTVRLGVEALDPEIRYCIFSPGDQPLLSRETLVRMGEAAEEADTGGIESDAKESDDKTSDATDGIVSDTEKPIFRLAYQERQGTPVAFPAWAFPLLKTLPEGKGGTIILKEYPDRVKTLEAAGQWELMDVDTPEDREELLHI
ncbi:MAG: NTP transferase domain-containing protein [Lachnospiraceae bacterium]|nr:NTP transferase domain-containing protein [Lachnospiraceae bacterium]